MGYKKEIVYNDLSLMVEYFYQPDESFSTGAQEGIDLLSVQLDEVEIKDMLSQETIDEIGQQMIDDFHLGG